MSGTSRNGTYCGRHHRHRQRLVHTRLPQTPTAAPQARGLAVRTSHRGGPGRRSITGAALCCQGQPLRAAAPSATNDWPTAGGRPPVYWKSVAESPRREVVRSSAGAGVVYPPFWGGHLRSIPQGMILDVQPLVKSLFCPIRPSPNGFFDSEAPIP